VWVSFLGKAVYHPFVKLEEMVRAEYRQERENATAMAIAIQVLSGESVKICCATKEGQQRLMEKVRSQIDKFSAD
jgi:hypothetical protein